METMWVKSPNQKSITLVDISTPHPINAGEYFLLSISTKEAEAGISKEVPANQFFHGMIAIGNLAYGENQKPIENVVTPKKGKKSNEKAL